MHGLLEASENIGRLNGSWMALACKAGPEESTRWKKLLLQIDPSLASQAQEAVPDRRQGQGVVGPIQDGRVGPEASAEKISRLFCRLSTLDEAEYAAFLLDTEAEANNFGLIHMGTIQKRGLVREKGDPYSCKTVTRTVSSSILHFSRLISSEKRFQHKDHTSAPVSGYVKQIIIMTYFWRRCVQGSLRA